MQIQMVLPNGNFINGWNNAASATNKIVLSLFLFS